MEARLRNILKSTNATKLIKTILKRSHKVLLDTCNLAALTWPVFLLRAVEFKSTFDIYIIITFAIF